VGTQSNGLNIPGSRIVTRKLNVYGFWLTCVSNKGRPDGFLRVNPLFCGGEKPNVALSEGVETNRARLHTFVPFRLGDPGHPMHLARGPTGLPMSSAGEPEGLQSKTLLATLVQWTSKNFVRSGSSRFKEVKNVARLQTAK
jgi:hypothetical protein